MTGAVTHWHPIDTAPRDGRPIIVFIPAGFHVNHKGRAVSRGAVVTQSYWVVKPPQNSIRKSQLDRLHGGYWSDGRALSRPMTGGPTHWQPMPKPPTTGEALMTEPELLALAERKGFAA